MLTATVGEGRPAPFGIEVVEPLWGESSQEVMADFLASGLKTVVVTTMDDGLGRAAVGRVVDRDFVASLPAGTDPNGENGEYAHFLLRRADLRFARAVPARNAFQPQLRRPARRRDVEELRLLVRRSAGGVIPLFAAGRNTGLCISVSSSAIGFVRCVFRSERRAVVATALSFVVGREHPASFSCSFR